MEQKKAKVAAVPCTSYEEETVYHAIKRGIVLLGGIEKFVKKEEKILVKPNFLSPAAPDKAVTTHPAVIKAMLRILQENGCMNVKYGDSPGHGSSRRAAETMGLSQEVFGARLAEMTEEVSVPFEQGMTAREFHFAKEAAEAEAIINLCKMKTHALERITGAVKNVYGLVCGRRKAAGHVKFPNASVFARMLVDIHRCVKPRLHIMDGIVAMEGNGPGSGTPVPMNILLFSEDAVALDTVFCSLVYLDPLLVPTNTQGEAMGLGTCRIENIEICLAKEEELKTADKQESACQYTVPGRMITVEELQKEFGSRSFDVDRQGTKKTFLSRFSDVMTSVSKRPVIQKEKCIRCGICVQHCPVPGKAVRFENGKEQAPVYDYRKCIRCYCCQEMCPQHAIVVGHRRK